MVGSAAEEIEIPKRLTGSVYRSCVLVRPVTAPVGSQLAMTVSIYAVSCTAPRLASTGPK
jgi:hypothetical protein